MNELLRQLLDALEVAGEGLEEIYDTEFREQMGEPIFHPFIRPKAGFVMPEDFGLYTDGANQQVKNALARYISGANQLAQGV